MSISFDDESLDAVPQKVFRKLMDDTFSADEQEKVLREFLTPIFDNIVATCEEFDMPYDEEFDEALTEFADEIEDEIASESGTDDGSAADSVCDDESEL